MVLYVIADSVGGLVVGVLAGDDLYADREGEVMFVLFYTSGISGRLKGVMFLVRALLANLD